MEKQNKNDDAQNIAGEQHAMSDEGMVEDYENESEE